MIYALHGAVGHSSDWRPITKELAKSGHTVKAVDLWRFLDCCSLSLEKTGAAINHEARASSDDDRILVGYSMGGRLALHALLDDPSLWKAAVLIAPHTGLLKSKQRQERLKADTTWASKALNGDWMEFLREWNSQGVLNDTQTPDRSFLRQRRRSIALSFTAWSLGMQKNLSERLSEINCPVLWITGDQDRKFSTIARNSIPQLPNAEHVEIKNSHHRLIFSDPTEIAEQIGSFVQSLA